MHELCGRIDSMKLREYQKSYEIPTISFYSRNKLQGKGNSNITQVDHQTIGSCEDCSIEREKEFRRGITFITKRTYQNRTENCIR